MIATTITSMEGPNPWMPTTGSNIMAAAMQTAVATPVVRRIGPSSEPV
jgi:hypothetical protein